ncbi:MAG: hypothetical protein KDE27_21495 [Planctomycetes bacterium]|nr:hypothetical protein [Planctomycetota bacterium]
MNSIRPFVLLAATTSLFAQGTATFPSDHAAIPNGYSSQNWYPFSWGVSRQMAVYESWDLTIPAGRQITRIGFRADGTTLAYGKMLQLEIRMGQTQETAASMLSNFDNNYLGTPTTVFGPALYSMPDLNNVLNPNPDGAYVWVTLTTPYTFDPTENLLVEWRVHANNAGGAAFNYPLDRAQFISPIITGPNGCAHSGNQIPELLSRPARTGRIWYCDLTKGPANQLAAWFINLGSPLQTPFSLAPFFPGIGATCEGQVQLNNLFSLTAMTGSTGYYSFQVPIPNDRIFNDLTISSQAACFDFFSPGGVVVSNGDQMQIGIDPAMTILASQGNVAATTGGLYRNYGAITLFDYN